MSFTEGVGARREGEGDFVRLAWLQEFGVTVAELGSLGGVTNQDQVCVWPFVTKARGKIAIDAVAGETEGQ